MAYRPIMSYPSTFFPIASIEPSRRQLSILYVTYVYVPFIALSFVSYLSNLFLWLNFPDGC